MEDTRKGFLTAEQEEQGSIELAKLISHEKIVKICVKLIDNQGLERLKAKLIEKFGEDCLPAIYDFVDGAFELLPELTKEEEV
jgi:uncharacterized NAD-dependent epimerase/dehydratase family protein